MAWVVDTSVLLDVRVGHPVHGAASAECLQRHASAGLVICPITLIEMAPAFRGDLASERAWLEGLGITTREAWLTEDTEAAHRLWHEAIERKRQGLAPRRPVADVLIAAFALRFDGLITRNETDFRTIAPQLALVVPTPIAS
jgi:predicted nucleic acid-binding protein